MGRQAPVVAANLTSPQATLRTFFDGMNDANVDSAVTALDLSWTNPIERGQRGPQLAFRLWAILNRQAYFELDKVPEKTDAGPYSIQITTASGGKAGEVTVAKSPDGAYRFTPATMANLDVLWTAVKDKPVIKGLVDPSPRQFDPAAWAEAQMGPGAKAPLLGAPRWKWLFLLLILANGAIAGWIVRLATQFVTRKILRLEKTDEAYREIARGGLAVSIVIFGSLVAVNVPYLGLPGPLSGFVGFVGYAVEVLGWVLLAFAVWDGIIQIYARRSKDTTGTAGGLVAPVVSRLGKAVIVVVAALTGLAMLGVNVTGFIATLGIGGVVLALAAKDSVENVFGSVMVLVDKPFRIGDWIKIGDVDGTVEDIRLRSTKIRTFSDSVITMPNSALVTKSVENFGMRRYRRLDSRIAVASDTSPDKLAEFTGRIRDLVGREPYVREENRYVYFNGFGATSLDILVSCYLMAPDYQSELEYRDKLLSGIVRIANEMGVKLASPG